jgi:hypothetical protein
MSPTREEALALKAHFEQLAGRSIYDVVEKDSYRPSM